MAMSLAAIKKQSLAPPRIAIYGDAGLGKTEFCINSPKPIFILTEDGLGNRKVDHFPLCKTLTDFHSALEVLQTEAHEYKTVVIDSADWLEKLIHEHICTKHKISNIDELPYAKGYTESHTIFGSILNELTALRDAKGMIVLITAHSQVKRVEDPTQPAFDAHGFKLHKKTAALLEEFCDVILFAAEKMMITTEDAGFGSKRTRPIATGERVIHAVGKPAYTAKNRYGLPEELPLDWSAFMASFKSTKQP
jgi:hypothetical protein